jgi:negative regulator of flagellin synthesis FlgM
LKQGRLARGEISVPVKISGYSTPEQIAPVKGSNGGSAVADKLQSDSPATAQPTAQTGDHVTLTDSARSLQKLSEAIASAPVVNAAKVASIKQAVNSGTYKIDAGSVADKLLKSERGLR